MRRIAAQILAVAILILGSVAVAAEQASDRAKDRRGFDTPPGLERKADLERQAVPVPDPGSTFTLLSMAIGGGLLYRGWASRRNHRSS